MPNENELGALWIKHSARGEYMTGTVQGIKVVVFKNERKTSDKAPDWRILKSTPRDSSEG